MIHRVGTVECGHRGARYETMQVSHFALVCWPSRLCRVIQEGWLQKKGEYIKNWRNRYFILREDGQFYGYKAKPISETELANPLNNFTGPLPGFAVYTELFLLYTMQSRAVRS